MAKALFADAPSPFRVAFGAGGAALLAAGVFGVGRGSGESASPPLHLKSNLPSQTIEATVLPTVMPLVDINAPAAPADSYSVTAYSLPQPSPGLLRAMEEPALQQALAQDYEFLPHTQYYKRLRFFMEKHEGERHRAYDCTAGACTVGIGFNLDANPALFKKTLGVDDRFLQAVKRGDQELNQAQIEALFAASIRVAENVCRRKIKNFDQLSQGKRIALTSLAFNAPALIGPKITKAVVDGNWARAISEIEHNSGAVNKGLRNRRADEAKIFQINADGYFRHIDPPDLPYHSGDEHSHAPVRSVDIEKVKIRYAWLGVQPKLHLGTPNKTELVAVRSTNPDTLARLQQIQKSLVAGRVA